MKKSSYATTYATTLVLTLPIIANGTASFTLENFVVPYNSSQEISTSTNDVSNSTYDTIRDILEELSKLNILIPEPQEVEQYLSKYIGLKDILKKISSEANKMFQPTAQISLEVYHDPEEDDQYLALYVRQQQYEKDIMDKIRSIRSKYRSEIAKNLPGWLLLTTDFNLTK